MVYISGEVNELRVYTQLAANFRIFDAIQAAGGFTDDANQEAVNLAAFLEDEDRIVIPSNDASTPQTPSENRSGVINLNTASVEELDQLPGVGPVKAQAIVDYTRKEWILSFHRRLDESSGY